MLALEAITLQNISSQKLISELPEFYVLKTVIEHNGSHDHDAVFDHCVRTAEKLLEILKQAPEHVREKLEEKSGGTRRKDLLFIAALFHDIGKSITSPDEAGAFLDHEKVGAQLLRDVTLPKIDLSLSAKERIVSMVENHGLLHLLVIDTENLATRMEEAKQQHQAIWLELIILVLADTAGSDLAALDKERYQAKMSFFHTLLI